MIRLGAIKIVILLLIREMYEKTTLLLLVKLVMLGLGGRSSTLQQTETDNINQGLLGVNTKRRCWSKQEHWSPYYSSLVVLNLIGQ